MEVNTLTVNDQVAEAGRIIMSQQLASILAYGEGILNEAEVTAVHEMRKSIRRTFTCFKLFGPYFEPGVLRKYRRGLRRIMRRLGYSRDMAVFRMKLEAHNSLVDQPLDDFASYWAEKQRTADAIIVHYLSKPKRHAFFSEYRDFTETPGKGAIVPRDPWTKTKIGHHIPILVYQRVAAVRAFEDELTSTTVVQLHRLRIQFKELRYTLGFFEPLLGEGVQNVMLNLKQSQEILGDLNDTTFALQFLNEVKGYEDSVAHYRAYQKQEQERLMRSFFPVWQQFNQPQWRRDLAETITML